MLVPLSFVFVFFHSHTISAIADQFSFVLLCVMSYFFMRFLLRLSFHAFLLAFLSFSLAFLSFMQFLLLTLPAVPCFFSSCFFILIFTPSLLYKRIWAFVSQIMLTGSKGSWAQFALICQSHFAEESYSVVDLYFATDS